MARGQDLTKTLDPKEVNRLRALLAKSPELDEDFGESGGDYPRMLYNEKFLDAQHRWQTDLDPLLKKRATEEMRLATQVVFDIDEETDYLKDGWKHSPADFLDSAHDPRIPRGREARKASAQQRASAKDEIVQLRRRLAELEGEMSGRELAPVADDVPAPVVAKANIPADLAAQLSDAVPEPAATRAKGKK